MKKNLISILILALLVVNIVLTAIMMFSVVGASKKTSALVTDIASVLNLEINGGAVVAEAAVEEVPISQTEVYNIAEPMTIELKLDEDGQKHYCVLSVALSLNMKHKGYKKFAESMASYETLIMSEINAVVGKYTAKEVNANTEAIRKEILASIQTMFESEFIYNVSFSDIKVS